MCRESRENKHLKLQRWISLSGSAKNLPYRKCDYRSPHTLRATSLLSFLLSLPLLNKCSTAQSFSSGLKYHCTRNESQMALHQRWDKHSFLSLPFIAIHLREWVCVHEYMRFTAALCSGGSNEPNLLCVTERWCTQRSAVILHAATAGSPRNRLGFVSNLIIALRLSQWLPSKPQFYFEKQSVAAFAVTPPKRSLSISLSAGGGRQMSSIGAWSRAKSFNISSPIIFDSFERRRLLSRNLCSPQLAEMTRESLRRKPVWNFHLRI